MWPTEASGPLGVRGPLGLPGTAALPLLSAAPLRRWDDSVLEEIHFKRLILEGDV